MDVKDVAQETCSRIALLGPAALSLQCMISVLYNSVLYIFSTSLILRISQFPSLAVT